MPVKKRKIPMRMCVGCREMKPKNELIRLVREQDNTILIDRTGKKSGRGAYICYDMNCLQKAEKSKSLNKAFEQCVTSELYKKLKEELENIIDK